MQNGRPGQDLVDDDLLAELRPASAINLPSVDDHAPSTKFILWGVAEDYRGGRDFSGVTFRQFGDSDLAACFCEDIPIMLDPCPPTLAIHHQIS